MLYLYNLKNKNKKVPIWDRKREKMKDKLNKEIIRLGSENVDHNNLKAYEAISMSIVAILALTIGTIYGDKLF